MTGRENKNSCSQTIQVEEFAFSCLYRSGSKPPTLVCIHGLGSGKESFRDAFDRPELAQYGILAADLPGHGGTQAPESFSCTMHDHGTAVGRLLDALKITGDVVLLLHSMGGPVGISLAETLGSKVKGIVYMEGNVDLGDCFASSLVIQFGYEPWMKIGFKSMCEGFKKTPCAGEYANSFKKADPAALYKSSADLIEVSKQDAVIGRLLGLKTPVLAVYGARNKGKWMSEKKLAAHFPLIHIAEAGHAMQRDNPAEFYNSVVAFLNGLFR